MACIATPDDDFKASPHLFASPNPKTMTTMTIHYTLFPLTTSSTKKISRQSLFKKQVELTPSTLPQHTNKDISKCTFSISLTSNYSNVKVLCNWGINVQVSIQDITKEGRLCMKSSAPQSKCAEDVLLMESSICTGNFKNNCWLYASRSDWTWHDL